MSGLHVDIQTHLKKLPFSIRRFKKVGRLVLSDLGWKKAAVSILLTDDREIKKYNRLYLHHNRPTDVIAFSYLEKKYKKKSKMINSMPLLGDLVISWPTAVRQAKRYGHDSFYELSFYLCHGLLHLMGYDDKTSHQARKMETMQKRLLQRTKLFSK